MASDHADAAVAIPWFNNIWFSDVDTRVSAPSSSATTPAPAPSSCHTSPNHPISSSLSTSTSAAVHNTPSCTAASGSTSSPTTSLAPLTNDSMSPTALSESQHQVSAQSQLRSQAESRNQTQSQSHSVSSSRQTISTLSAVDRISLISLFSTGRASASDILRTLSDPDLMHLTRMSVPVAIADDDDFNSDTRHHVDVRIVPIRSAPHIRTHSSVCCSPIDDITNCTTATPITVLRRVASTPSKPS